MMFIIIAIGYFVTKKGILSVKARADVTDLVLYVVLPCNIFSSFSKDVSSDILRQCFVVLIVSTCVHLFYTLVSRILYLRARPEHKEVMQYATIISNSGFMGLPVIESVFGQIGLLYGSINLVPLRIFMWTAGLSLFTKTQTKEKIKMLATHPCIWAVVLGLVYLLIPLELPSFIMVTIDTIGNCTTMLSMLVVGSLLSGVDLKSIVDKDCFYFTVLRLIAIPAVVFCALLLLKVDKYVTGVVTLSSAMPAATVTAMLAEKYGRDSQFASKILFISTAFSLVTLPVAAKILTTVLNIS